MCAGKYNIKMFTEDENLWDFHRGRQLEEELRPKASEIAVLDKLAKMLRESKWRASSRSLYNTWFRTWMQFCKTNKQNPMKARPKWVGRYLTYLTVYYSVGTVQVAASALAAIYRLNGIENPLKGFDIEDSMKGIEQVGIVGCRSPKYVVDASFVVGVAEKFVDAYPVYDQKLFDPQSEGDSIQWLRGMGMIVIGLELGVRPSSLVRLTTCCWQPRQDGSVAVQVDLAKAGKNGEVFAPILERQEGLFQDNCAATSFYEEYLQPFIEDYGIEYSPKYCIKKKHRTAHCENCPKLFEVFSKGPANKAVNTSEVSCQVKKWARRLGRDPKNYSAVSLRRGSTSIAAAGKVAKHIRKKHGGWKSERMPEVYTELSTKDELAVSKSIHEAMKKTMRNKKKKVLFRH